MTSMVTSAPSAIDSATSAPRSRSSFAKSRDARRWRPRSPSRLTEGPRRDSRSRSRGALHPVRRTEPRTQGREPAARLHVHAENSPLSTVAKPAEGLSLVPLSTRRHRNSVVPVISSRRRTIGLAVDDPHARVAPARLHSTCSARRIEEGHPAEVQLESTRRRRCPSQLQSHGALDRSHSPKMLGRPSITAS